MRTTRFLVLVGLAAIAGFSSAPGVKAQQKFTVLGPNECLNCHDHEAERQWYEKKEIPEVQKLFPDKGMNAGHINSLKQLETPKSNDYAKAIGLADKYDVNGACVRCHGTVFGGDANAGVSCESCHGPASGYLKPHQTKGAYEDSVKQFGQTKLVGNMQGWTQQCTNCHVMDDDKLIKAGHPSGDDFDLGKKYQPVSLHFKKMYAQADVAAIGKSEMDGILRRRGRAVPVNAVAAAPPPPAAATPEPATAAAPVATPAPTPTPEPAPAPTVATTPRPRAARAVASKLPAIDLAAPPAGTPTSIEPPPPPDAAPVAAPVAAPAAPAGAAPAAAAPAAPAVAVPSESTGGMQNIWLYVGGGVVILGGLLLFLKGKKS